MHSYKQDIKQEARLKLWSHAINSLTIDRNNNRILKEDYIKNLWMYTFSSKHFQYNELSKLNIDLRYLNEWCDYSNIIYGRRDTKELRVAYLCGPEPENDLEVLLSLGIRIENVWAIESDRKCYESALKSIKSNYPTLKVYNGKIDTFFQLYPLKFDIIYLDFTAPLFSKEQKPFATVNNIFDKQILSEFGILITNSCLPNHNEENVAFLTDFFLYHEYLEGVVHGIKDDENQPITWFSDGVSSYYGKGNRERFLKLIDENFEAAYSSFCSIYPIFYANLIAPAFRFVNNDVAFKRLITSDKNVQNMVIDEFSRDALYKTNDDEGEVGELYDNPENFIEWLFIESLKNSKSNLHKYWYDYFSAKENGTKYSRFDAVKFGCILRSALIYSKNNRRILSSELNEALTKVNERMKPYYRKFCDILFPFIWCEVPIYQFGFPYHPQFFNHKRFTYKAKTNNMFVDIFTFDQCRSFYDWLPTIEFYETDLLKVERQMLSRICIDAIGSKQCNSTFLPIYNSGCSIIGMYEESWAEFVNSLPIREDIGETEFFK